MSLSTSLLFLSKDESCGDVGGVLSIIKKCCLVVLSFGHKQMFVGVPALEVNIYPWHTVNVMNFMNDLNCWFISTAQKTTSHFF